MSPEQLTSGDVDERNDLFSIGVMIVENGIVKLTTDTSTPDAWIHGLGEIKQAKDALRGRPRSKWSSASQ